MIWPWSRFEDLQDIADALRALLQDAKLKLALAEQAQRTAERDCERALAELHLVQQDHRHLVATVSGRLAPRTEPLDLHRDPFAEDDKLPTTYVDEVAPEDLLLNADAPVLPDDGGEA